MDDIGISASFKNKDLQSKTTSKKLLKDYWEPRRLSSQRICDFSPPYLNLYCAIQYTTATTAKISQPLIDLFFFYSLCSHYNIN